MKDLCMWIYTLEFFVPIVLLVLLLLFVGSALVYGWWLDRKERKREMKSSHDNSGM